MTADEGRESDKAAAGGLVGADAIGGRALRAGTGIPAFWQHRGWRACSLLPLAGLHALLLMLRRALYALGLKRTIESPLPVVVVGNLSVGGTGKTPLCAELVRRFQAAGWQPAIVSRGYGGQRQTLPHLVTSCDSAAEVGDEPLMLQRQTGVPVCVCVDRAAAVAHVKCATDADIVFSDDGLQHLRMGRRADIVVIDGARGLGNRWLMPAGPLREGSQRLRKAELVAIQLPYADQATASDGSSGGGGSGDHSGLRHAAPASLHRSVSICLGRWRPADAASLPSFCLHPDTVRHLGSGRTLTISELPSNHVHAVAGIGHPARFFDTLSACGLTVQGHAMPDHHALTLEELSFGDGLPVLITAKDAARLSSVQPLPDRLYEVGTQIHLGDALAEAVSSLEQTLRAELAQLHSRHSPENECRQ